VVEGKKKGMGGKGGGRNEEIWATKGGGEVKNGGVGKRKGECRGR